ncbi:hypothetical protein [Labrenzia sp. CE80]|uniref:hypothetical protein n=1 Tax=Labrenzia sp. CE80 TaxID=1788986 RepID=UPI00129AF3FD|nr:hypothetical protein [Labrenzia sp. CE80]
MFLTDITTFAMCFVYMLLALPFFTVCWLELDSRQGTHPIFYALILLTTVFWPLVTVAIAMLVLFLQSFAPARLNREKPSRTNSPVI